MQLKELVDSKVASGVIDPTDFVGKKVVIRAENLKLTTIIANIRVRVFVSLEKAPYMRQFDNIEFLLVDSIGLSDDGKQRKEISCISFTSANSGDNLAIIWKYEGESGAWCTNYPSIEIT